MADLDLNTLVGAGDPDRRVVETAYEQVEHSYYQAVDSQLLSMGKQRRSLPDHRLRQAAPHGRTRTAHGRPRHRIVGARPRLDRGRDRHGQRSLSGRGQQTQVTDVAVGGMLGGLGDPYTTYLSASAMRSLDEELKAAISAASACTSEKIRSRLDPRRSDRRQSGNSRRRAHRRCIIAVDNQLTAGMPIDDVERHIRGPRGTVVALRVKRHTGNAIATLHVTRDVVHVPSVRAKIEDGFSYVRLSDFGQTSADEVRDAFAAAKKQGVKGYILDLRNNAAACSTPRSTSRAWSCIKDDRRDDRPCRPSRNSLGNRPRDRSIAAGATGEQVHRQRFRNYRRRAPGRPPRDARRHEDLR